MKKIKDWWKITKLQLIILIIVTLFVTFFSSLIVMNSFNCFQCKPNAHPTFLIHYGWIYVIKITIFTMIIIYVVEVIVNNLTKKRK